MRTTGRILIGALAGLGLAAAAVTHADPEDLFGRFAMGPGTRGSYGAMGPGMMGSGGYGHGMMGSGAGYGPDAAGPRGPARGGYGPGAREPRGAAPGYGRGGRGDRQGPQGASRINRDASGTGRDNATD